MKFSLVNVFKDSSKQYADRTAIICEDVEITYGSLIIEASKLANYLQVYMNVKSGDRVGICLERSEMLPVVMLSIVMVGAAYIPLDPTYPCERLQYMQCDSHIKVLLTESNVWSEINFSGVQVVLLDQVKSMIDACDETYDYFFSGGDDLAYVMYTSGTTGKPKGVAVPQRGIVSLVLDTNYISIEPTDRVAQVSNSSFDAATFEIWGALLNGATLVVIKGNDAYDPRRLAYRLKKDRITTVVLTSAVVSQIADIDASAFSQVTTLLFGGEKIEPKFVKVLLASHPPHFLRYMYGPTETTTFASGMLVESVKDEVWSIPIGFPIANTQIYLLDEDMNQLPVGAI
ncbi:AMP-binding protein, partial [Acinetobacter pittii]|uniref:AMP-binding protein n=1 Tax=Acinetobacter pittii TaxID=48296 RepID=UPI0021D18263